MRGSIAPVARLAAVATACLLASGASAQHPGLGAPEPRPLHVQLASADAVAIATVGVVGLGRIQLVEGEAIVADVPATFELKRAPSAPPPLEAGDRVVLLLRGARTPYLLVSESAELVRVSPTSEATAWRSGLRGLRAAGSDHLSVARIYASWLEGTPVAMQREAAVGLSHPDCPESAFEPALVARLAELATLAADAALRRWSARAVVRTAEGRRALLARMPGDDAQVLATALRAGASKPDASADPLLRALRHEDAAIRAAALRSSLALSRDRLVRAQIVRIASEDPDASLRELARRVMRAN